MLPEKPPKTLWWRFLLHFKGPLIYILLAALVIDLVIWIIEGATGLSVELLAIALILLLNAGLGVYQEGKAEAALQRLKVLAASRVRVMRDGKLAHLPATELVGGDVARTESGRREGCRGLDGRPEGHRKGSGRCESRAGAGRWGGWRGHGTGAGSA